MRPFIPSRLEPIAFGFLLSGFMSLLVSFVATFTTIGFAPNFVGSWLSAWVSSWLVAFPAVLVVAPFVRRLLRHLIIPKD